MSTGEKIILFRQRKNLSKSDLAKRCGLRENDIESWEDDRLEPNGEQLRRLARGLGVEPQDLLSSPSLTQPKEEVQTTGFLMDPEVSNPTSQKPLGYCSVCHKAIYAQGDLVETVHRGKHRIYCAECLQRIKENRQRTEAGVQAKWRNRSFIYGSLITAAILAITLVALLSNNASGGVITFGVFLSLFFFPFISCLFLRNNFVMEMVMEVGSWGFVRMPGVIFSLDFGGIIFLIVTKIILFFIAVFIASFTFALAIFLGYVVSLFVYPFALVDSYTHPEKFC